MVTNCWTFHESVASVDAEEYSLRLHPLDPRRPLELRSPHHPEHWPAISIEPVPAHAFVVEESYLRGSDLITRYAETPSDNFALQLNWRLIAHEALAVHGVELWISLQTSRLDTSPHVVLTSHSSSGDWRAFTHDDLVGPANRLGDNSPADILPTSRLEAPPAAVLLTRLGPQLHAVWLIEPSDQSQFHLSSSLRDPIQRGELFGQFLEKGVIRRARMRLLLVAQPLDHPLLVELYQQFADSPLPLTA